MNALVTASRTRIAALAVVFLVFVTAIVRADDLKDGHAALAAGNYDQALALFEKAAGQGYAAGRAGVGEVWLKRRQYAKALEAFQLAQKMDAGLPIAYYGQGEVLRRQGKCDEALPALQKATAYRVVDTPQDRRAECVDEPHGRMVTHKRKMCMRKTRNAPALLHAGALPKEKDVLNP